MTGDCKLEDIAARRMRSPKRVKAATVGAAEGSLRESKLQEEGDL